MEAWFLREWQRNSVWQILLRPLSWLFGALTAVRRWLYRSGWFAQDRIDVPVIVVGNITVGGTGKTPLVLALAQSLERAGYRPGIVTRGYVRSGSGHAEKFIIHVVPAADAEPISDEAALLANRSGLPVYAGARRVAVARALRSAHADVNVIISDDGLQHYALRRDIEICVVDGARGLGNGALLPAGPLRESHKRMSEVDAIVVNGGQPLASAPMAVPLFAMTLANETFVSLASGQTMPPVDWRNTFAGKRIAVMAGTGNPARFFAHMQKLGIAVDLSRAFPDHHAYVAGDIASIAADIVLMTEKDAVKCNAFADDRMWFMRVDAVLPDAFSELVLARLSNLKV